MNTALIPTKAMLLRSGSNFYLGALLLHVPKSFVGTTPFSFTPVYSEITCVYFKDVYHFHTTKISIAEWGLDAGTLLSPLDWIL